MAIIHKIPALFIIALLSQSALALPDRRSDYIVTDPLPSHTCFTYTVTSSNLPHPCPLFNPTTCGPHPDCIVLEEKTVTVPCKNPKCTQTPTITIREPSPCPSCQKGCGTEVITTTLTSGCPSAVAPPTNPTPVATA